MRLPNFLRFDAEKLGNPIRDAWDRLSTLPLGSRVFSEFIGRAAPYTGTIGAQIDVLEKGYCKVTMRDRRGVRNHLRSVHAIALANLCELTGNAAVAYALPDDARFIVAGLTMEYIKKARGTLTAESRPPAITSNAKNELAVVVEVKDSQGDLCARCTLRTLIGPKKAN